MPWLDPRPAFRGPTGAAVFEITYSSTQSGFFFHGVFGRGSAADGCCGGVSTAYSEASRFADARGVGIVRLETVGRIVRRELVRSTWGALELVNEYPLQGGVAKRSTPMQR